MKFSKLFIIILILCSIMPINRTEARKAEKISLTASLTERLNTFLLHISELHRVLSQKHEDEIQHYIYKANQSISDAQRFSVTAQTHQIHLGRLLEITKRQLEIAEMTNGERRTSALKEVYRNAIEITRTYKTKTYPVYYCSIDRSIWMQEGSRPKHPFEPEKYRNCGVLAR